MFIDKQAFRSALLHWYNTLFQYNLIELLAYKIQAFLERFFLYIVTTPPPTKRHVTYMRKTNGDNSAALVDIAVGIH